MATQPETPEAGLRNKRLYFIRESEFGVWGSDPDMDLFSDSINSYTFSPGDVLEERRGVGDPDVSDHERAPESHAFTINYDLVKWPSATGDASYDGLARDSDNLLPSSHTVIERTEKLANVPAAHTVEGSAGTARPQRIYTVMQGGLIDSVEVVGDPSAAQQVQVELTYTAQYVRPFKIDQPTSGEGPTEVTLASTDAADTSINVTIEDEGAGNAETIATDNSDGTTVVSTTVTYSDIDAIEVTSEHAGDIVVSVNTGTAGSPTAGDKLAVIPGTNKYNDVQSDDGVPALGSGSQETVGSLGSPEKFIGDTITTGGNPIRHAIASGTLSVSNNVTQQIRQSEYGMTLHPGNRDVTFTGTMYSEDANYDALVRHLQNTEEDIVWTLDGGTFTLPSASLSSPGEKVAEEGNSLMTNDNEFTGKGLTIA